MNIQDTNRNISQKTLFLLGILAGLSLLVYGVINVIQMPAVSPDAFVPKTLAQPEISALGLIHLLSILGFAFAFLPVTVMFTVKRYKDNPYALVFGCSLLCLALVMEIFNNLPFLGSYVYPGALATVSPEVLLYLSQTASIRYLSFDVAGFTILYVSLLIYAAVYWKSKRMMGYLVLASVIIFSASAPFLWINGTVSILLLAISVVSLAPVPFMFGRMAVE